MKYHYMYGHEKQIITFEKRTISINDLAFNKLSDGKEMISAYDLEEKLDCILEEAEHAICYRIINLRDVTLAGVERYDLEITFEFLQKDWILHNLQII